MAKRGRPRLVPHIEGIFCRCADCRASRGERGYVADPGGLYDQTPTPKKPGKAAVDRDDIDKDFDMGA